MMRGSDSTKRPPAGSPRLFVRCVVLALAVLCLLIFGTIVRRPDEVPRESAKETQGAAVAALESPYLNVQPDVKYVGDAACASCHEELVERYHSGSMGRSLMSFSRAPVIERFDAEAHNPFVAGQFRYEVRRNGERTVHVQQRLDAEGRVIAQTEAEVQLTIGSGHHGRSYLINRDGYLFMSPMTWYPGKGRWDLSPGYEARKSDFGRPITVRCLFCHSSRVEHEEHSLNRYRPPTFQGHAIGCERCHGPGELHVERREREEEVSGIDFTIVNPADLPPVARDGVCHQCHYEGVARVEARGRKMLDYRPGLPLRDFISVYVERTSSVRADRFATHVEQIQSSRCFQESAGELSCISCHDSHGVPAAEQRVAFFRDRCLACHEDRGCSLPHDVRLQRSRDDSCMTCHMPALKTEVPHTVARDHRILRRAASGEPSPQRDPAWAVEEFPFYHSRHDLIEPSDSKPQRDLGIAVRIAAEIKPGIIQSIHLNRALPLLEAAVKQDPGDLVALESLGITLRRQGRHAEALKCFQQVLDQTPKREYALSRAASIAIALGRMEEAARYAQRAIDANPWMVEYREMLARAQARGEQWRLCNQTCTETLRQFPNSIATRRLLIESYLGLGQMDRARQELNMLLRFQPEKADSVQQWFDTHPLRGKQTP